MEELELVDGEINLDEREELESEDGKHYTQGRVELDLGGRREESRENWGVLGHQLPPPLLPPLCNIRGACLGKY